MQDTRFPIDARPSDYDSGGVAKVQRQRGQSSWPFGPVGIRERRRDPFRANELGLTNSPRRRWTDRKAEPTKPD